MASTAYRISDVLITGTPKSPQTINYEDLTDIDGSALPAEFAAAPVIFRSPQQDRNCFIVAKTATSFQVALSDAGVGESGTFDFIIVGESA